jgi:hypothetical protein
MSHTENQLRLLAKNNPQELIRIITSPNGNVNTLISGAELLGEEITDESVVSPVFRQLLKHSHAFVREAAMNGIGAFFSDKHLPQDILDRLLVMSSNDPLSENREIAKDLIAAFKKK